MSRSLKAIGHAEDNERERRAIDDATLVCGATAEPERKNDGDGEPCRALEVVERLVSRWKGDGDNRKPWHRKRLIMAFVHTRREATPNDP